MYKSIKQHNITDCGAACIATISKQHGLKIPITKIREVAGTDKQEANVLVLMTPSNAFKKGKETKGLFERFFHLLIPQKKLLVNIFFASILYTLICILGAFYFKFLIDDVLSYGLERTLHVLSIGAVVSGLIKILMAYL